MNELLLLTVAQSADGASGAGGFLQSPIIMLVLMFGVMYFLLIRPQQKQAKERREMLGRLKKGDSVVTNGGLIGTVFAVTDTELSIQINDKTKVRVLRQHANLYQAAVADDAEKKDK